MKLRTKIVAVATAVIFSSCSPQLKKDLITCVLDDSISVDPKSLPGLKSALAKSSRKLFRPVSKKKYRIISAYIIEAEKLIAIQNLPTLKCNPERFKIMAVDTLRMPFQYTLPEKVSASMLQDSIALNYLAKLFQAALNKNILMASQRLAFDTMVQQKKINSQCRNDSIDIAEQKESRLLDQWARVKQHRIEVLLLFPRAHRKILLKR